MPNGDGNTAAVSDASPRTPPNASASAAFTVDERQRSPSIEFVKVESTSNGELFTTSPLPSPAVVPASPASPLTVPLPAAMVYSIGEGGEGGNESGTDQRAGQPAITLRASTNGGPPSALPEGGVSLLSSDGSSGNRGGGGVAVQSTRADNLGVSSRRGGVDGSSHVDESALLRMFADEPDAPFSIHRVAFGGQLIGSEAGSWFGPTTISQVLTMLLHGALDLERRWRLRSFSRRERR